MNTNKEQAMTVEIDDMINYLGLDKPIALTKAEIKAFKAFDRKVARSKASSIAAQHARWSRGGDRFDCMAHDCNTEVSYAPACYISKSDFRFDGVNIPAAIIALDNPKYIAERREGVAYIFADGSMLHINVKGGAKVITRKADKDAVRASME